VSSTETGWLPCPPPFPWPPQLAFSRSKQEQIFLPAPLTSRRRTPLRPLRMNPQLFEGERNPKAHTFLPLLLPPPPASALLSPHALLTSIPLLLQLPLPTLSSLSSPMGKQHQPLPAQLNLPSPSHRRSPLSHLLPLNETTSSTSSTRPLFLPLLFLNLLIHLPLSRSALQPRLPNLLLRPSPSPSNPNRQFPGNGEGRC